MTEPIRYWFPAKRYGYGWSFPATWEGWLVLLGYMGLMVAGAFFFPPDRATAAYIACVVALSGALLVVCYATGEPPAWRWGDSTGDGKE